MLPIASRRMALLLPALVVSALGSIAWLRADEDAPVAPAEAENIYLAREGLSPDQLLDFIDRMKTKPVSIRNRPGFDLAVIDACERILGSDADATLKTVALREKLDQLHYQACRGDVAADEQLRALAEALRDDPREKVAREAAFLALEQRVLAADDLPDDQLPALLDEVRGYFTENKPQARHLRMASSTVRMINRVPGDEAAEKAYREFGALFAKSDDRELSRYGRKIEKGTKPATLVGKEMELAGTLVDGTPLDWASYRGKVVLVDFWATWCGPCRAELPNVKQAYETYHDRGFEVVGISLDAEREVLEEFLRDEQIPWPNLFSEGDGWKNPLAVKYGVQAIPATFLIDATGKVMAENVRGPALAQQLEKLLGDGAAAPEGEKDSPQRGPGRGGRQPRESSIR